MMEQNEIKNLKNLQYEDFVQKTLTELILLSKNHNILDELLSHSKDIGLIDDVSKALSNIRDEKILDILKNEKL